MNPYMIGFAKLLDIASQWAHRKIVISNMTSSSVSWFISSGLKSNVRANTWIGSQQIPNTATTMTSIRTIWKYKLASVYQHIPNTATTMTSIRTIWKYKLVSVHAWWPEGPGDSMISMMLSNQQESSHAATSNRHVFNPSVRTDTYSRQIAKKIVHNELNFQFCTLILPYIVMLFSDI